MKHFLVTLGLLGGIGAQALSVQVGSYPEVCGYGNGRAWASAYGGVAPYTYSWDNGGVTSQIAGLLPGTYTVTVTDNVGTQVTGSTTVGTSSQLLPAQVSGLSTCPGYCSGETSYAKAEFAGTPPYTYSIPPSSEDAEYVYYGGVCWWAEGYEITITDANGCAATFPFGVSSAHYPTPEILQVMPSCEGVDGHIVFRLDFTLETTLRVLDAQSNVVYEDGAPLAETPITVGGLAAGDYTIQCISNEIPGGWCYGETPFTVNDLGTDCGRVMGRLFVDASYDCSYDTDYDTGMPYRVLVVEPGPVYGMSDASGNYTINLVEGSYTIQNDDTDLLPLCPATEPAPFDITAPAPVVILDLIDSSTVANDLELTCAHGDARPGFIHHVWLTIANRSPYFAGSPNLVYNYDPLLTFVSSSYGLYTLSPGQISWAGMYFLPGYATRVIHLQFQVPADVGLIGSALFSDAFVQQSPPETDISNNACGETVIITGSYDPNDKVATTSSDLSNEFYFLDQDTSITYVIRFQNTGTATAQNVMITDTLPQTLDPATLRLLGWSHQFSSVEIGPGQLLTWHFDNINLPDSGANESASHGFLSFHIRPREPLTTGTQIINTANIYFDTNPAVITEPSVLTAEFSTGVGGIPIQAPMLAPNPASDHIRLMLPPGIAEGATWTILSTDGRIVASGNTNASEERINISSLADGTYLLRSISGDRTFTSPFMKHSSR